MLATLGHEKKRSWSHHIPYVVHAYNSTKCDATGYSPYLLMFGREARLPVDLCFGTSPDGSGEKHHSRYVENLRGDLQKAYELASKSADKIHQRNKKAYDQKVRFQTVETGDRVLLRNLGLKGKHKLESRWSSVPYVIVGKLPNLPVYRVKPEDGSGGVKTIHRDHLLPISQSMRMPVVKDHAESVMRPMTCLKKQNRRERKTERTPEVRHEDSYSSSDVECGGTHRSYREYLQKFSPRRTYEEPAAANSHSEHEPSSHEQSQDEEEVQRAMDEVSEKEEQRNSAPGDRVQEECQSEDDVASADSTNSDHSDSELDQGNSKIPVSTPKTKTRPRSMMQTSRDLKPRTSSKRQVKPVIRLTYDEPGKARDQPITIVHKGVIIKLGC